MSWGFESGIPEFAQTWTQRFLVKRPKNSCGLIVFTTKVFIYISESSEAPVIPPEPKDLKCKHSNITNDKDLPSGVHKNNFTVVKDVDTMAKCMEKCCDSKDCDLAYMVEKKCYSVSCSSKEDCRPVSVKASKKSPLISAMVMKVEPKEETGNADQ